MSIRKAKSAPKLFISDPEKLQRIVSSTLGRAAAVVGATLGPGGRNVLIESDYPGIPNKNTKDGVTVFQSLGASDPFEHLVLEQTRAAAQRTATEAGDGTTTATILSAALVDALYAYCEQNPKESPQKVARRMQKIVRQHLIPFIHKKGIAIHADNMDILHKVAKVSANGDEDMADAVIEAFNLVGFGEGSHVTIKELSGPYGYDVSAIEGFPIQIGYEESIGKFHPVFINDKGNQRVLLDNPLFLLFDGNVTDLVSFDNILAQLGNAFQSGNSDYKNVVIVAHGFSEHVLNTFAFNFVNPDTINVIPLITPMAGHANAKLHFLHDIAAFTGAKIFGLSQKIQQATPTDLGHGMTSFEMYRFRSTVIGKPDEALVEIRADELQTQKKNAESDAERIWIEERIGKLTSGIAKLTIYGGSSGELKELSARAEDAVMAVRSAINKGALAGGCRTLIDLVTYIEDKLAEDTVATHVLAPAMMQPFYKLLQNAGYNEEEIVHIHENLIGDEELVYDVENQLFGTAEELGLFDCLPAVAEALTNATGIATVMGTIGGLVAYPRDDVFERSEATADRDFERMVESPGTYVNEANNRP